MAAFALLLACETSPRPKLERVEPTALRRDRQTRLTIFGSGFVPAIVANAESGGRQLDDRFQVTLGSFALTDVVRVSDSELRATCPPDAPLGMVDLIVTDPRGQIARLPAALMVLDGDTGAPRVVFETPAADAEVTAGQMVHIRLSARDQDGVVTEVAFDAPTGSPRTWQLLPSPPTADVTGELDYFVPPDAVTGSRIVLTARARDDAPQPNDGLATLQLLVKAPLPGPHVFAVVPARGPTTGGQTVTIVGTELTPTTVVEIDGRPLVSPSFVGPGQIRGVTPPRGAPAKVAVKVTDTLGSENRPDLYEYGNPPMIVAVEPVDGPESGGLAVTVTGYGFDSQSLVAFAGAPLGQPSLIDAMTIRGLAPPGTGIVDVILSGPAGETDRLRQGFRYWPMLALERVTPPFGPAGRSVGLKGLGFTPGMQVFFGGAAAQGLVVTGPDRARVDVPPGAGLVDVLITNPVSSATLPAGFEYR